MRRLLSFVLLAAMGLPLLAPLLALAQDSGAGLPACCRRHGAHHCAMAAGEQSRADQSARIGSVCPRYPQHTVAPLSSGQLLLATSGSVVLPVHGAETQRHGRLPAHQRIWEPSHPKRGPPAETSDIA